MAAPSKLDGNSGSSGASEGAYETVPNQVEKAPKTPGEIAARNSKIKAAAAVATVLGTLALLAMLTTAIIGAYGVDTGMNTLLDSREVLVVLAVGSVVGTGASAAIFCKVFPYYKNEREDDFSKPFEKFLKAFDSRNNISYKNIEEQAFSSDFEPEKE
jgi:hypothetical protein